jgi:hypothetical protein
MDNEAQTFTYERLEGDILSKMRDKLTAQSDKASEIKIGKLE